MPDLAPFEQLDFEDLPESPRRPHGYSDTEGRFVEVSTPALGSIETHYRVCGEGEPLLLVHGLMTSSYAWRYVFDDLGRDYRLYAPDLPGAGRTDKPLDVDYDPRDLADWIAAFQRAVDIHGSPVVGNSLGGYLGVWMALRQPDALSALIDVHSPGVPTARMQLLRAAALLPGVEAFAAWLARRNPRRWAHENVHYYDETLKSLEEARVYGEPLATERGSRAFAKYLTETLDAGIMGTLTELLEERRREGDSFPVPLALVYAEHDPMVPPDVGERLAELLPEADYRTLPETSHFVQVDTPETFTALVREFLQHSSGA